MAGVSVGSVSVSVVPSAEGWNEELREQLLPQADELGEEVGERIADGIREKLADLKANIGADAEEADSVVDELREKIDDLSGEATIGANAAQAKEVLDELREEIDETTGSPKTVTIDADAGEATAELSEFREGVDHTDAAVAGLTEEFAALSGEVRQFGAAVGEDIPAVESLKEGLLDLAADLEAVTISGEPTGEQIGHLRDEMALLGAELDELETSFGSSTGPFAAFAAGADADAEALARVRDGAIEAGVATTGFTGPIPGEVAELEALDGAARGAGDGMQKLRNDAGGGGGGAMGGGLMAGLLAGALAIAPAFIVAATAVGIFAGSAISDIEEIRKHDAQFQGSISQIKAEYDSLAKAVKPEVITDFNDALNQARQILPEFTGVAEAGGKAVGGFINQLGNFVHSGDTKSFLSFVGDEAPSNVHAFGNALQGAATFVYGFTESLDGISKTLLSVAGGLLSFGGQVLQTVPWLGQWAVAIGAAYFAAVKFPAIIRSIIASNFVEWLVGGTAGLEAITVAFAEADTAAGVFDALMVTLDAINPLVWLAGAVVAIGALGGVMVNTEDDTKSWIETLAQADDAAGSNVAGYQKLSAQLKDATAAQVHMQAMSQEQNTTFEEGHLGIDNYSSGLAEVTAAQKKAAAAALEYGAAQGRVSTATLEQNVATTTYGEHLASLQNTYHLTTAQAIQLANGAKVSAGALSQSGAAGEAAMEKITAYADAGAKASSQTVQFAVDMAIAGSDAFTLTSRVQALTTALSTESSGTENANTAVATFHQGLTTLATDMAASADKAGYLTKAQQATALALSQSDAQARAASAGILQITGSSAKAVGPLDTMLGVLEKIKDPTEADKEMMAELRTEIDALKSKSITIGVHIEESGSGVGIPVSGKQSGTTTHAAGYASGGRLPGYGGGDRHPALLESGETVVSKEDSSEPYMVEAFRRAGVPGYASGGAISASASFGFPQDVFNIQVNTDFAGSDGGFPKPVIPGLNGSLASELKTTAGETAAQEASQMRAMESAGRTIVKAFADGSLTTVSQIKSETQDALHELEQYYSGPAATRLEGAIKEQSAQMEKLAAASEKVSQTIANMKAFSSQEVTSLQGFSGLSNITGTTNSTTGTTAPVTGSQIASGLQQDLATLRRFEKIITQLKDAKVAKSLIEQVIAMGPAGGIEYGEAILSGGKQLIAELNHYESAIGGEETVIGHTSAEIQYGQSITKGWLSSLDKDKSQIDKKMQAFGKEIARELEKAFHVKIDLGGGAGGAKPGPIVAGAALPDPLTRPDINDIRNSLRRTSDAAQDIVTKSQAAEMISLLKGIPKATGTATGTAVADALNSAASRARAQARAKTR